MPLVLPKLTSTFDRRRLQAFCDVYRLDWHDNTSKGGNLAVLYAISAGAIANQLKEWGFSHSSQKKVWWRKDWPR